MLWPSIAAGSNAPAHPQPRQRVLDHKQRRLRVAPSGVSRSRAVPRRRRRIQQRRRSSPRCGRSSSQHSSTAARNDRLARVQLAPHPRVLRPLAREQKRHPRRAAPRGAHPRRGPPSARPAPAMASGASRATSARRCAKRRAAHLQRVRHVGQLRSGAPPDARPAGRAAAPAPPRCAPRAPASARAALARPGWRLGRLLQHHVRVGPADAERADARRGAAGPWPSHGAARVAT